MWEEGARESSKRSKFEFDSSGIGVGDDGDDSPQSVEVIVPHHPPDGAGFGLVGVGGVGGVASTCVTSSQSSIAKRRNTKNRPTD